MIILLIVGIADQLSAQVIKPWIGRSRPCHIFEDIILLVNCGSGRSFPSAHATNNFAVGTFLTGMFPRKWWLWLSIALLVAVSRVFVGVHYPLDITAGAFLGAAIGWWAWFAYWLISGRGKL
jgi:undecaprenyl-diphosphatase